MYYPQSSGPVTLRSAIANIHRDPQWWRKVLLGGALTLTVVGMPWAAGLVVQSYDAIRRGYPTPLPPGGDWSTRYIIGFLALMIDFAFFMLPLILAGVVMLCGLFALTLSNAAVGNATPVLIIAGVLLAYWLLLFAFSITPTSRMIYAIDGRVEEAMSMQTVRIALSPDLRIDLARARLQSLPAYLPALVLGTLCWLITIGVLPGALLASVVLLWLTCSAVMYAHLVTAQFYATIAATSVYNHAASLHTATASTERSASAVTYRRSGTYTL